MIGCFKSHDEINASNIIISKLRLAANQPRHHLDVNEYFFTVHTCLNQCDIKKLTTLLKIFQNRVIRIERERERERERESE